MADKAIKYKIYPTTEQRILFARTFGCCRKVWNLMLSDKVESYKVTGKFAYVTPAMYKKDYPYLREVDSLALANVQMNLQAAFKNCFDKKRKKRNRFPKFKSAKHSRRSYTTNNQKGTVAIVDGRFIKLPKVGKVKAVIHRMPEADWVLKSATVSQDSDGRFYASVLFEFPDKEIAYTADTSNAIGLDYKSDGLYVDSNGNHGSTHKYFRESQKKLAKAQRKLKHKIIGSNNYKKQQKHIARIYRHAANQRLDSLHKLSTEIANRYDAVCVETLNMKAIANKKVHNGKSTMDNGYGIFLKLLEYKLADRGKYLIKVDRWYPSSQLCHVCGYQNHAVKDTAIRRWICPKCGTIHDRDINAAVNILNEGLRMLKETA